MIKTWKNLLTACLFFGLALILAGCFSSGKNGTMEGKMDDSMSGSMENMEKMKKESMQETMN
jgi:hypothetical protein